jgi:hypothetical protein
MSDEVRVLERMLNHAKRNMGQCASNPLLDIEWKYWQGRAEGLEAALEILNDEALRAAYLN